MDELKRENQKLLQIIAQLQSASLGCVSPAMGAASVQEGEGPAVTASHSCLSAGESGGGPSGVLSSNTCAGHTVLEALTHGGLVCRGCALRGGGRLLEVTWVHATATMVCYMIVPLTAAVMPRLEGDLSAVMCCKVIICCCWD